jgi:sulfur transfer complex TusBCD TusB component (DsrH family)
MIVFFSTKYCINSIYIILGDNMRLRMLGAICLAVLLGYLFGKVIFNQYQNNLLDVFREQVTLYFLQQGVYSSVDSMNKNTTKLKNYIYVKENDLYRVYAAITRDIENANKLKEYFNDLGNDIYVKEIKVSNRAFINIVEQYDKLLALTDDGNNINNIVKEVLTKYQELVVDGKVVN